MKGKRILFYLLLVGQLLVLAWFPYQYERIEREGREVLLRTERDVPFSRLPGDEVSIRYEIERLPLSLWKEENPPKRGEIVYVLLQPRGRVYEASGLFRQRRTSGNDSIYLKGKVTGSDYSNMLFLEYGPARYALPERLQGIDKGVYDQAFLVTLKVAPWGDGKIVDIRPEGK